MNKEKLHRTLDSVGKAVFVKHFVAFRKCAETGDNAACAAKLESFSDSDRSRQTRCSKAKSIFLAGKECKALQMCAAAKRVPNAVRIRAEKLRQKYCP